MAQRKHQADGQADVDSQAETAKSSRASPVNRKSRRKPQRAKPLIPSYLSVETKRIWLTLDDGPHPTHTKSILKVLSSQGVSADVLRGRLQCVKLRQSRQAGL